VPRILHISDVHFGPHHLKDLSEAVVELVERERPDAVLISGDLTQRAKPKQFREAREFVDRLAAPTLCVPGNHDVPLYRFWERFGAPYGAYRKHFSQELEPVLSIDGVYAVGLNSAYGLTLTDGRVRMRRLVHLADQLAEAPEGSAKVVVIHHPVVPPPLIEWPRAISNARELAGLMRDADVDLVLSGHIHQTYVTTCGSFFGDRLPGIRVVHTGTTTSDRGRWQERGRNTLNWIAIDSSSIEITPHVWDANAETFVEISRHRFPRRPHEVLRESESSTRARQAVLEDRPNA